MKYIGPFLRINTLTRENVEKQLSYFARESFKHIVLNSRCGITTSISDFKLKNIPNFDISIFKKFSPLLCVYKKSNPKLSSSGSMSWDENTFKKEISVSSNAYMTLTLIELAPYYAQFKDKDSKHYALSKVYSALARKQLDFYSSYLRNSEGVFVDKKDNSDNISEKYDFEEKDKKFKYSDQALLMCAYYRYADLPDSKDGEAYKSFSLDILNMFLAYKDEIYHLSFEELNKLSFALNLFCRYSGNEDAKMLLMDIGDLLMEKQEEKLDGSEDDNIENLCSLYLNLMFAYENTRCLKFKDYGAKIYDRLLPLYDAERGIFKNNEDKKEIEFSSQDIVLYLMSVMVNSRLDANNSSDHILVDVFKRQLVNSGVILSWPDAPTLDNPEKYSNFSMRSDDLLDDQNFRMATMPTPANNELAPVFIKSVQYHTRKETFSQKKNTFDSTRNMPLLFLITYILEFEKETEKGHTVDESSPTQEPADSAEE